MVRANTQHNNGQPPAKKRCRREGAKWTRSGCLTCKRRRKRCDEAKPCCHSCTRLGLTCEGYGSMWTTPLGLAAQVSKQTEAPKRRGSSLSHTQSISSIGSSVGQTEHGSIASSPLTEQDDINSPYDGNYYIAPSSQLAVISPSPSRFISHLTHLETHYLQYHMEKGSKLLANLETDENPLRSLIIPRALSSPVLMNALCALSAIHFSNRAPYSWAAENEGAGYYINTMRGLRTTLTKSHAHLFPDDAILAVALLCKYEIVRGSVKQWAIHLDALETLVISRGGFTHLNQETAEFIRGLFVYANNLAKITNRRAIRPSSILGFDNVSSRNLDIYIGYTEEIIKICARIADLPLSGPDLLTLALEVNTIDTLLRTWTSTKTTYIIPKGMTDATLSRLRMVANSFRDATYIYLHSTLERITPSPGPHNISLPKHTAISNLLERIKTHPIDDNCEYSALTFPLFIAGCETASRTDRTFILQTLSTLEANFGIGNVKRAKEILGILWSGEGGGRKRRHWVDVLEGLGWDLILA
ncbi:fungal-specific transcription factor domain-containing protein [Aspergillus cavernicola]|uniref:Fungal-specific transcription factor domain-containing protein n=1 Tax=Aspergillus cavernicola TaxID=176166 RepID=A0ABR4ILV2_9EURO